ncbi:hypothetical protein [Perlucidibaca piscinae]|uniref:hypothetical protein n=1 Tax=Perlucidibaca piscinae TaxID=392589 RepID=UPI0003B4041E|nr:hypothetical protein [Perlucidibaca piscinae]
MNFPASVIFPPWVGPAYLQQDEKWLILGESNYGWTPGNPDDSLNTQVSRHILGEETPVFRNIQKFLRDDNIDSQEAKREFWNTCSYYNYVTESMSAASARPTANQFHNSHQAFVDVVNVLKPDIVLVLGFELWDHLPGAKDGWMSCWSDESQPSYPVPQITRRLEVWSSGTGLGIEKTFHCFSVPHPAYRFLGDACRMRQALLRAHDVIAAIKR